ncbi:MAG TPA: CARDB domain-containing protein [Solirubrobacterales bacterium]|nr:CARDB domain-containing protein [Solirubrobacterales bacterium]
MEDFSASRSGRRPRPRRRPQRQQILLRRGLALGGGLLLLILIVLGVKGCLDARKNRALSDYARNVTQIVEETDQTSKSFFEKLEEPGDLSVTEFINQVNTDRSAIDSYAARVDGLDAPGDMSHAQNALELVYELRASAMNEIAEKVSTALATVGAKQATRSIAMQMRKLLAADSLYAAVVRPEINGVLADNGIDDSNVPKSVFLPDETRWLDEGEVSSALGSVSGSSGGSTAGVHGLELSGTSVNGTALSSESTTSVVSEGTPEVEVEVENQGESTENGINVSVSVSGGSTLSGTIDSIEAGAIESVSIPLTPAPSGEVTIEVKVDTVPGEKISENNEASYGVVFE